MKFDLKAPCKNCPFKNNVAHERGWLGKNRAEGIIHSITEKDQSFPCHKTLDLPSEDTQHCAGAAILLERMENPNQWMRIAERINRYDRNALVMDGPVFDTAQQFIDWHAGIDVKTTYQKRIMLAELKNEDNQHLLAENPRSKWILDKEAQLAKFLERMQVEKPDFSVITGKFEYQDQNQ